jgi:hypothetical protein
MGNWAEGQEWAGPGAGTPISTSGQFSILLITEDFQDVIKSTPMGLETYFLHSSFCSAEELCQQTAIKLQVRPDAYK